MSSFAASAYLPIPSVAAGERGGFSQTCPFDRFPSTFSEQAD